jgi:flagellin
MGTIGTNVGALNAAFYLTLNNESLTKTIRKMSAGSRLADPTDDAAGVAVSGKLDSNIRRLMAATEGSQNVISYAQTTDGFLATVQTQLTRMSELAQRATNGAFGSADRANYATEFNILKSQIANILSNATFNGQTLFNSSSAVSITVAINANAVIDTFSVVALGTGSSGLGISNSSINTETAAAAAISTLNTAITSLTNIRATVNANISKFNFHIQNIRTERINVEAANSRIKDLDIAQESTNLSKSNILLQAATSMLAQANASQNAVLGLLQ